MSDRRVQRIEREARFEAARGTLLGKLGDGRRDDGWFSAPGLLGRRHGRDVDLRFPGGADARRVRIGLRIRTGPPFVARLRGPLLRRLGFAAVGIRGTSPPEAVHFVIERLLVDHDASWIAAGAGLVQALVAWDPADPERVLRAIDRLDLVALALEEVKAPRVESGGLLRCPFCRERIADTDVVARCDVCMTPHHPSCFEENHGCAVYGCRNRSARTTSARVPLQK